MAYNVEVKDEEAIKRGGRYTLVLFPHFLLTVLLLRHGTSGT